MVVRTDTTLSKLQPGTSFPTRIVPEGTQPIDVPDAEIEPPKFYQEWALTRIKRSLDSIAAMLPDMTRLFDETAGETVYNETTGETQLNCIAEWEPASELITMILVTGPPSTAFTLQLGNRAMNMLTDASGKLLLAPVQIIVKPTSLRQLTSATAGQWFLELAGHAISSRRYG